MDRLGLHCGELEMGNLFRTSWEQLQEVSRADAHMYRIFVLMLVAVAATPIDRETPWNLVTW